MAQGFQSVGPLFARSIHRCSLRWIDSTAAELAETTIASLADNPRQAEFAWLNVVKLRYALVKLLAS